MLQPKVLQAPEFRDLYSSVLPPRMEYPVNNSNHQSLNITCGKGCQAGKEAGLCTCWRYKTIRPSSYHHSGNSHNDGTAEKNNWWITLREMAERFATGIQLSQKFVISLLNELLIQLMISFSYSDPWKNLGSDLPLPPRGFYLHSHILHQI